MEKKFNYMHYDTNNPTNHQDKMYRSLVELERTCKAGSVNQINEKVKNIINIASTNSDVGLESMRSVNDYFLNRGVSGVLLTCMTRLQTAFQNEINKREARYADEVKKKSNQEVDKAFEKMKSSVTAKKVTPKKIDAVSEDFPVFAEASFPDTNGDVFEQMLKTS